MIALYLIISYLHMWFWIKFFADHDYPQYNSFLEVTLFSLLWPVYWPIVLGTIAIDAIRGDSEFSDFVIRDKKKIGG